jgi:hypothetical protein
MADIISIRTAIAPSKPISPVLLSATSLTISLKFFNPADNGGSDIVLYELFRNDGNTTSQPTIKV